MHLALYRKWRPTTFDEVYGQEHITTVLKYEVANKKTSHAYLFSGSRGTGKTTCAKIMAKSVNCLNSENGNPCGVCESCVAVDNVLTTDILEMDAASNTGVDYIRDIKDEVAYAPSMLRNRVYIIDEVHMLSISAFNALLKTLEEPPENVVFILATTEPQKIPATVLSRCQRFEFRRISNDIIADRIEFIAKNEEINIERDAAIMIARLAQGGMRDAISMLELCSGEKIELITEDVVLSAAGVSGREQIAAMCEAVLDNDIEYIFKGIAELYISSKDIGVFWSDLLSYYRDMLIVKTTVEPKKYLDLTQSEYSELKKLADRYTMEKLLYHCKVMDDTYVSMQYNNISKRLCAEMTLVKMANKQYDSSSESLLARIASLENRTTSIPVYNMSDVPKIMAKQQPKVKRELKALQCWADLVKQYDGIDKTIASFLARSKGYSDGVNLIITVTSSFEQKMIDNDNVKNQIISLLTSITDTTYETDDIKIELKKQENTADDSFIDDFVDKENL